MIVLLKSSIALYQWEDIRYGLKVFIFEVEIMQYRNQACKINSL